jgi:pimeloyl-ACP methyl ester carboxylesterase
LVVICLASSLFARDEFLPTIEDTLCPAQWLYAGPFSVGAREGIVGVIDDPENFRPEEGQEHPSILPQGGKVSWKKTSPDSAGWVNLEYQEVWWDTLMTYYGVAGILDAGYAYAEFVNSGRKRALAIAEKIGSFYLNGKRFAGDPYGHGFVRTPVVIEDGMNRVLVQLGGYGDHRFMFELVPEPAPVIFISQDATLPDIIEGEKQESCVGITLLNTTSKRLSNIKLSVVPLTLEVIEPLSAMDTVSVPLQISYGAFTSQDRLLLRVRNKEQSRRVTFISKMDGSCQYCAVLPPKDYDPQKEYALILTLHGAGVEASRLVDCHAQKDWAFVVAPTNRRKFGFDWQDWGRLDALEVLDLAEKTFPIDANRVYLTGHSMGGHGTWHISLAHPDLFAAAAPMAGWTCFQLYIPWFLQKSYIFAEPGQIAIRDMSLREDFVPDFVENASNLPIFISHGGNDDNVPPVHSRMFASRLEQLGYEYHYKEIPGKGHWFNLDNPEQTVCVDNPEFMDFLEGKERDPHPQQVVFKTTNLGQNNKSYWVEIIQQGRPFFESRMEAEAHQGSIEVKTQNVREFALHMSSDILPYGHIALVIDGEELSYRFRKSGKLFFHKKGDRFRIGQTKRRGVAKTSGFYGPIKQAYFSPFVLVYGTKGDSLTTETTLHQARLEATRWWRRANGQVAVLPDTEVTSETMQHHNLILFGGPEENFVTGQLSRSLPIRIKDGKMFLGKMEIHGETLAAEFIYPNPANAKRFVFVHQGVGTGGLKLSNFFTALYSGAGLPDFVIFDRTVKQEGWGGVICAGFFDSSWQIDERLYYLQE